MRYIFARDRIVQRELDLLTDDCHLCGNRIRENELYFCVSRLHQMHGSSAQNDDEVLEALASLQICANCLSKAGKENIKFLHESLVVLKLEKEGLYRFARYCASRDVAWVPLPEGRDSCSLCQAAIGIGDRYTLIEITKERQNAKAVQIVEEYPLSVLCEACAEKYLVWLYMGSGIAGY